jgi:peptidoglycan endopeptidase LytE
MASAKKLYTQSKYRDFNKKGLMKRTVLMLVAIVFLAFISAELAFAANITHKVKSGDNLYTVSKKYRVSVDQLKTLNSLSSRMKGLRPLLREESRKLFSRLLKTMVNLLSIGQKRVTLLTRSHRSSISTKRIFWNQII